MEVAQFDSAPLNRETRWHGENPRIRRAAMAPQVLFSTARSVRRGNLPGHHFADV